MTITEKVAYLRGLFEGMGVDENTNEGKLFKAVIDVLDDMAYSIADVEDGMDEMSEQIETIDEDLDNLEQDFYGVDEDEEDEEVYEITCPNCGEKICLDFEMLSDGEIECPGCGEHLEFDLDECGCEDCSCCGDEEEK
ncbi:MAG: hypothetical protein HFG27_04875 [Provencibacterium sp.]|jgi:hypothetical protein|nr:hypothetical protein [Provencibacterium sp.]